MSLSWDADGRNVQLQQTAVIAPNAIWSNVVGAVTNNAGAFDMSADRASILKNQAFKARKTVLRTDTWMEETLSFVGGESGV